MTVLSEALMAAESAVVRVSCQVLLPSVQACLTQFGAIFSIEGMIQNIEKELNAKLDIILTGGFSKLISSKLSFKHKLEPNLTLDGIRLIYEDNHVSK